MIEKEAKNFLINFANQTVPIQIKSNLSNFIALTTGDKEEYSKLHQSKLELHKIYSNPETFEIMKKFKESKEISDSMIKREIEVLYPEFVENQGSKLKEEILTIETEIQEVFSKFRVNFKGKEINDNEVDKILIESIDNKELEDVWFASKQIGGRVAPTVLKLVKLRNKLANELGFENYYKMAMQLSEQDPNHINKIFDELEKLTTPNFKKQKEQIDNFCSTKYNIKKEELMVWHYQNRFFQAPPQIHNEDMNKYFTDKDIVEITKNFYSNNYDPKSVKEIFEKSSLFPKENKYQHACCLSIDNGIDTRVICNVVPNYYWFSTLIHEFAHAMTCKFVEESLPWILRTYNHLITTEAVALLYEDLASNANFLVGIGILPKNEEKKTGVILDQIRKLKQVVFAQFSQVMFRFEQELYQKELTEKEANILWWNLVEKYQLLKKPPNYENVCGWASKIHLALNPCYYHFYLIGFLIQSQLKDFILSNFGNNWIENLKISDYLIQNVIRPGKTISWLELVKKATGKELSSESYIKEYLN